MERAPTILVTGSAGFIGHHLFAKLQQAGYAVVGLDSINAFYDPELKYSRLAAQGFEREEISYNKVIRSKYFPNNAFVQLDLTDEQGMKTLFEEQRFDVVINLAAQAGVRYSLECPRSYIDSNIVGFVNLLECCRHFPVKHLLFASSSSVYGNSAEKPFHPDQRTDQPVSLYAATKKANEVLAYSYAHLYNIPTTGLRFFTVYGPWGRPDMAYYSFTKAILEGNPISVFNNGDMYRDFTYVDDVVNSILKLMPLSPATTAEPNPVVPFKIYNIGNNKPEHLLELIAILERLLGKKAILDLKPMQPGDVYCTYADVDDLMQTINYKPTTTLEQGLTRFVDWYKQQYVPAKENTLEHL
ncbi:NAD-dependent epimerase/dehydratase family protein [Pontibacter fetidus]|uniref:NAD-dependent epimerase/dehydratase family protein n=1 Tax=Pontibacter fetidus TaxID=2700082 RepID=A0A6B2H8Y6_9BACT|nr:NAD-dependent epimerase/dehydratase family protein [Pontibacter fetidus]NDK55674.1 NAD-dependent epimerase/dehydratase family protein [Pontibacter fetidus]